MTRKLFCILFVLCLLSNVSDGCNCSRSLAVDRLCYSDFVMKAHIKSEFIRIDSVFGYYRIRIKDVYKGSDACDQAFRSGRLYSSCECHPSFSSHEDYLITGRIKNGYLGWCDSCDLFKHWQHLSYEEKCFIEGQKYCHVHEYPKSLDGPALNVPLDFLRKQNATL